jgi:Fe2+ or Zn2+ uptake regulation protein
LRYHPPMAATAPDPLLDALRGRGMRVTPQRLAIAAAVRELGRHATAEEVFSTVAARMPGVSLPTVYATLELLEDLGLVRRVATESGTAVYDPRTDEHHHLVCRRCGAIVDVDAPVDHAALLGAARGAGFRPDDAQVVIRGLCASCAAAAGAAG